MDERGSLMYAVKFFDLSGNNPAVVVVEHDTIEQALEAGRLLGAQEWFWDTFCLGTMDYVTYQGMRGSLCIVNQEYFDGRFDG